MVTGPKIEKMSHVIHEIEDIQRTICSEQVEIVALSNDGFLVKEVAAMFTTGKTVLRVWQEGSAM